METVAEPLQLTAAMANTRDALIESVVALERMEASLAAQKAELIDQLRQWSEAIQGAGPSTGGWSAEVRARRELVSELACALRMPERSADRLIDDSQALVGDLPATFAALSSGEISWRLARVIVDHAGSLEASLVSGFEAAVLPAAKSLTVAKFDRMARAQRERMAPETIDARHLQAVEKRSVELHPDRDGMAWISSYQPIAVALGIFNRVDDIARGLQSPTEPRTLAQLRADVYAELLLDGTLPDARATGIRPRVLVTVPVHTLLGHGDESATLEGYGPIDRETALGLAASAPSFTRLLTHPETGAVLSVGRESYAVPADLRTWLRVRDGTCRFPGCSRAARSCQIDHTRDWQFGHGTNHDNLAHLCSAHHHLKHQTGWRVRQVGAGVLEWTSPSGRVYSTEPVTRMGADPAA